MSIPEPSDGMSEEVERQLQLAISAAALAARKAIANRQAALADAQAQSTARADELRAQLDRHRTLASSRIQPVFDRAWWENASPSEVGEMWQETEQWREPRRADFPTIFDHAVDRIEEETRDRWQLDVHDIAVLAYHDNVAEDNRPAVDALVTTEEHQTAEQEQASTTDMQGAEAAPDSTERYDTRARRDRLQQRMAAAHVPEDAIEARILTDTAQARPTAEAVQQARKPGRDPKQPRVRTAARQRQRTR